MILNFYSHQRIHRTILTIKGKGKKQGDNKAGRA